MANILIRPVIVTHETEKAVLVFDELWLPKSHIVIKNGYVFALAGWLYQKHKKMFKYANHQTMEELEEWLEKEKKIAQMLADDPTLCRCSRCGCLFRTADGRHYDMCCDCDVDYSIHLGHAAKFGMTSKEESDAAIRGIIHKP
jgi:hypothetical protein